MNLEFLKLDTEQRTRTINEAAVRRSVNPIIMEKDFWVCWMLPDGKGGEVLLFHWDATANCIACMAMRPSPKRSGARDA